MNKIIRLIILIVTCAGSNFCFAEKIIYRSIDNDVERLVLSVLKLVVEKSGVEVELIPSKEQLTDERAISELESGGITVYWSMTSVEYEQRMRPILYPIDKGLLGYRVFLIRKGDQKRFSLVKTQNDLAILKAGQGHGWPDTAILRAAGLNVVTTTKYKNLFPMLDGGRFDYFPRGVFEPWSEINDWSQYPLEVEKNIFIKYPTAMYFFVSKRNERLAKILEVGFEKVIADGSFDKVFYSSRVVRESLRLSGIENRIAIEISNPLLPSSARLDRKELWFDLNTKIVE